MRSLRTKLIVTLVPLAVLVVGAMTWLAVAKMTHAQQDVSYREMRDLASAKANAFDAKLEQQVALTRSLAATMTAYQGGDRTEVLAILQRVAEAFPASAGVYVAYLPGLFDGSTKVFSPYWNRLGGKLELDPAIEFEGQAWFETPRKAGRQIVLEPYLWEGSLIASYIAPLYRDGEFVGVAGNDASQNALAREAAGIRTLETGYAFLVSNTGIFLSAPDRKLAGKVTLAQLGKREHNPALTRMAADVRAGRGGQLETTDPWTGKDVVMSWSPIRAGNWSLVTVAPKSEVLAATSSLRWQLIVAALIGTLLIAGVVVVLAARVTRPLTALGRRLRALNDTAVAGLTEGIGSLARGDLTVAASSDVEPLRVVGRDEVADASRTANELIEQTSASVDAYNDARASLATLIGQVSASASQVAASSQQMASTSQEAGRAVNEIAGAVTDVAQGAERQVQMVDAARAAAEATATAAERARELADEGSGAAEKASAAMAQVRDASGEVTEAIRALAAKSDEIGGIVHTITRISQQTNLLALNAAIEAARAGESGRGFAVVADEVRKLAEESQQAAATISHLVDEIQTGTNATVSLVEDGAVRSEAGAAVVEEARDAFSRIGDAVRDVSARIAEIAAATSDVASVAEQSSASAEEVSASTQQTSASTQQIAASAQELARTAEELDQLVGRFQLEAT